MCAGFLQEEEGSERIGGQDVNTNFKWLLRNLAAHKSGILESCPVSTKIDITLGQEKKYPPTHIAEQIGAERGYSTPHVVAPDGKS